MNIFIFNKIAKNYMSKMTDVIACEGRFWNVT